jgi:hypothetical protein
MAKRTQQDKLYRIVGKLLSKFRPDDILHEMSVICEQHSVDSDTEAEVEFWLKTSKATGNLRNGTEKWWDEMIEEMGEEEEEG